MAARWHGISGANSGSGSKQNQHHGIAASKMAAAESRKRGVTALKRG